MHEAEARAQGRGCTTSRSTWTERARVEALPMLDRRGARDGLRRPQHHLPCKQAVIPLLDEALGPRRGPWSAVNTVVNRGPPAGHNTDGSGWIWGFRRAPRRPT